MGEIFCTLCKRRISPTERHYRHISKYYCSGCRGHWYHLQSFLLYMMVPPRSIELKKKPSPCEDWPHCGDVINCDHGCDEGEEVLF